VRTFSSLPLGGPPGNLPKPVGPKAKLTSRSLIGIGILIALGLAGVQPVAAGPAQSRPTMAAGSRTAVPDPPVGPNSVEEALHANDQLNLPAATSVPSPGITGSSLLPSAPLTSYNKAGLQKEVFAFAPYWALSQEATWNYKVVSTFAYYSLYFDQDGFWIKSGGGYTGYNSQAFVNMINSAHAVGDRVVLVIRIAGESSLNHLLTVPTARQQAITNTIDAIITKNLDGVNIDFEGYTSGLYPNIQAGLTSFATEMSTQVHQKWSPAFVTIDTYTGSASWDFGLMRIDALAPVVDAMFIMAYDMSFSNLPGQAGPNAPISGWTYNDRLAVSQYLTKAPASKIILGVPWYGYRFNTTGTQPYGKTSSATADSYAQDMKDLACGKSLVRHWDAPSQSPWASWYSPSSNDPCGQNKGSWQELYYDDVASLGVKYNLVNTSGIRGTGMWALGYETGHSELWSELSTYFNCPATLTLAATQTTTQFTVGLSAGTCSVRSYDVAQLDVTQAHGWYSLSANLTGAVAQGFPGYTYEFAARAHSTAGVVSAWTYLSTSVDPAATYSHPFKGLYTLDAYGGISADSSPPVFSSAVWSWKIARAAKSLPGTMPQSGATLDGYGGMHPFGAPITIKGAPYWRGWDIARDFAFLPDGSGGYVLDGFGGLHPFAVGSHAMPAAVHGAAYFAGNDVARKVVIFSDGTGGYVMDAFGGMHPFGIGVAAPKAATGNPYWKGWAIARDVVLVPGSHGGYVLDAFGGIHAFSGARALATPAYWPGSDIARSVWLLSSSTLTAPAGYLLDAYGGLHPFGGAPAIAYHSYWSQPIAHNLLGF
jgi:spore germination protein YaaH